MVKYNWSFCLILYADVLDFCETPGMLVIIKIQLFIVACNTSFDFSEKSQWGVFIAVNH